MNREEEAFLIAIREDPDDTGKRLIFADWLEENARSDNDYAARAEFIRVQCELARMDRKDPHLADKSYTLQKQFAAEYKEFEKDGIKILRWERGFPMEIQINGSRTRPEYKLTGPPEHESIPTEKLVSAFERICNIAPIKCVKISGDFCDNQLTALGQSDTWLKIKSMTTYSHNQAILFQSDKLKNVEHINLLLSGYSVDDIGVDTEAGLQAIARNPHLRNLKTLDCSEHDTLDRAFSRTYRTAIESIATSPNLPKLQNIILNQAHCSAAFLGRVKAALAGRHRGQQ